MDMETAWWDRFGGSYGVEFERARPDYHKLDRTTGVIGALMKLELDLYNGGFLQFFCNWGYPAYLLALEGLEQIGAVRARSIVQTSYSVIRRYENDSRIRELEDIATVLSPQERDELDRLDQAYWEDADGVMERMLATYAAPHQRDKGRIE